MKFSERISLKPEVSDVVLLNDWLDGAFAKSKIEATVAADLKLCINEVVANLISHGFSDTPNPTISIEIELEPWRGVAVVVDNGAHFDPRQWPPAEKPKDLMSASPGGFGISLIRERASHLDYARAGNFNQITIVCSSVSP